MANWCKKGSGFLMFWIISVPKYSSRKLWYLIPEKIQFHTHQVLLWKTKNLLEKPFIIFYTLYACFCLVLDAVESANQRDEMQSKAPKCVRNGNSEMCVCLWFGSQWYTWKCAVSRSSLKFKFCMRRWNKISRQNGRSRSPLLRAEK